MSDYTIDGNVVSWNGVIMHRLLNYDYGSPGAYFITICTIERRHIFGCCKNGEMHLSHLGALVKEAWKEVPTHEHSVETDEFIVMPNHVHGILWIKERNQCRCATCHASTRESNRTRPLAMIVGSFKAAVTKQARKIGLVSPQEVVWQRNYHDHIIRSESSLANIQSYILDNPSKWETDEYFSDRVV